MGAEKDRLAQIVDGPGLKHSRREASRAVAGRLVRQPLDRLARRFEVVEKLLNTHRNFNTREQ